ncbi:MAG: hypothetical protein M1835_004883 [Candelina submexicana]|nr:MAG: hypothetical protein M1835_004883 [Candelina submexicana]
MKVPLLVFSAFLSCIVASVIQLSSDSLLSLPSRASLARSPRGLAKRNTDHKTRFCGDLYGRPTLADCEAAIAQLPTDNLDAPNLFWTRQVPGFAFNAVRVLLPLKLISGQEFHLGSQPVHAVGTCIFELTNPVQGYRPAPNDPTDPFVGEALSGYDGARAIAEFETYREVVNVADEVKQVCVTNSEGGKQRLGTNLNLQVKLYSPTSAYALQRQLSTLNRGMPGYALAQQQLERAINALGNPPPIANPNQASTSQAACIDDTNCLEGWTCATQETVQWYLMYGTMYPNLRWCEAWLDEAWQEALNVMDDMMEKLGGA